MTTEEARGSELGLRPEAIRAARILSYVAASVLLSSGLWRALRGDVAGTSTAEITLGLVFLVVPSVVHRCPGGFLRWRYTLVALAFCVESYFAWTMGPARSQFYFDGVATLAVGYLLSGSGLLLWVGLKLFIQLAGYWSVLQAGTMSRAELLPIAQGTLINLLVVAMITYLVKQLDLRWKAQLEGQQAAQQAAKLAREQQLAALKAEKEKSERLIEELAEVNRELTQASEVRGRFLANMSHEIRTPMNAVVGMSELLLDGELSEEQIELAGVIQGSSSALLRVLNDILDLSKLQAGRMEVHPGPSELRRVLAASLRVFEAAAQTAGLELSLSVDPALPAWVSIDAGRVGQILANYLSNALKFTEEGAVRVRATRPRVGWLRVEVEDSGVGIPAAQIERLFRPFEQLDSSTTRGTQGTGLGLSISNELADRMGGTVGAVSTLGEGSTFFLEIPAPLSQVRAPSIVRPQLEARELRGLRVLIADDNEVNRKVAVRFLERLGMEAVEAVNGEDTLQRLAAEGPFDVVLMDCQMPRLDGYQTTRYIRGDARFARLPVIALTASALEHDIMLSRAAGMNAHLAKPYSADDLSRVLQDTLREAADVALSAGSSA